MSEVLFSNGLYSSLNEGIVAYYPLDGNAIDVAKGHNGTATNISYLDGRIGKSANFTGSSSSPTRISIDDYSEYHFGNGDFTISAWIKRASFGTRHVIISQADSGGNIGSLSFTFEITNLNVLRFNINQSGVAILLASSLSVTDSEWHHCVVQRNGNFLNFFLDGVQDTPQAFSYTLFNSTNKISIGAAGEYNGGLFFNGRIDELGIWNRALSSTEINLLYRGNSQYPFKKNILVSNNKIFKTSYELESEVSSWASMMTVRPSDSYLFNLDTMVKRYKAAGIWNEFDRFWVYATEQQEHARIDIKALQSHTEVNSPTWISNQGYSGSTTGSRYINTNYVPSVNGSKFTLASASLGIYSLTNDMVSQSVGIGSWDGSRFSQIWMLSSGEHYAYLNESAGSGAHATATDTLGMFMAIRTGQTALSLFKNSTQLNFAAVSAGAVLNTASIYVLARNSNGTANNFNPRRTAMAFIGSGNINPRLTYEIFQSFANAQRFNV